MTSLTSRVGYGLRHPALTRIDALSARLAKIRFTAPAIEAPAFADRNGEIYADEPISWDIEVELDAPPEVESAPDFGTPATLEAVEAAGIAADAEAQRRVEYLARMRAYQNERAELRIERAELRNLFHETGDDVREELARISARMSDLDDYLIMEPDCDFDATPWGDCDPFDESEFEPEPTPAPRAASLVFRGSAKCDGAILIGRMESNAAAPGSIEFEPVRQKGERAWYQIQPFWGELPSGTFRKRCDGLRKQTAFIVLEMTFAFDPATRGGATATAERFFKRFASTFLNELPVEAQFSAGDVLTWVGAQKR